MEIQQEELEINLKFQPALKQSKNSQKNSCEFKFKKTILSKPMMNCFDLIYMSKEASVKKKLAYLKPFERNKIVNIPEPVLGKKAAETRSISVPPMKKGINVYQRETDLFLPVLSKRHKKTGSKVL